jgi:hypothetical protein
MHGYRELDYGQFSFLISVVAESIFSKESMHYATSISVLIDDEEVLTGPEITKMELYYLEIADDIFFQLEPIITPLIPKLKTANGYIGDIAVKGSYLCLEVEG